MKHFLNVQNGHVFALFLCIFTNFFLILLIKKGFLRLLLCIFHNRQKKCRKPTRRCGQHASSGIHRRAFQPVKGRYSFSCQLLPILILYRTQHLLAARLTPPGVSRQTPHAAVLLFLQSKSQPSVLQPFKHSVSHFSINLPQKKLSRRLSFSRCI